MTSNFLKLSNKGARKIATSSKSKREGGFFNNNILK